MYFAKMRPEYSHKTHTISELAESASPFERHVSFGVFLPFGAVLCVLGFFQLNEHPSIAYLMLAVGLSYFLSAFFPCDANIPALGSWKNAIHNVIGGICYATMLYLLNEFSDSDWLARIAFITLSAFVVFVVIGWPRNWLGLAQRLAELCVFLTIVKWILLSVPA